MTRRFRALMDGGFPYFVASVEGRVIGYAYAGPYRPRPAYRFTVENSVYLQPAIHRLTPGAAYVFGTTSVTFIEGTDIGSDSCRVAGPVVQVDTAQWANWRSLTTDARTAALDDLRAANAQALRAYATAGPDTAASAFHAGVRLAYGDATNQLLDHEQRMFARYAHHPEVAPARRPGLVRDEPLIRAFAAAFPPPPSVASQSLDHRDGPGGLPPAPPAVRHGTAQVLGRGTKLSR
jgi:hypothetical protein